MTFTQYVEAVNPYRKLQRIAPTASPRKLRLFACACVRDVGLFLKEDGSREAILVAERFADGRASPDHLAAALGSAESARARVYASTRRDWRGAWRMRNTACAAKALLLPQASHAAFEAIRTLLENGGRVDANDWNASAWGAHARLLHDIFGDVQPLPQVDPAWLRWNGSAVVKMAEAIYEERSFEELPILGDVLEDAGCDDPDMLSHCRDEGPHVRGCWVVDLLLGKG